MDPKRLKQIDEYLRAAERETPEQKAKRIGVPLLPGRAEPLRPHDSNPTRAVCGVCGIELKDVMHYSCSRSNCPVFTRVTL